VQVVLGHLILPGPRAFLRLERAAVHELFGFGRWILASTALTFLATQGDRLFLGYAVPMGSLGLYFIATRIVELATALQGQLASAIVFPTWVESARLEAATHVDRLRRSRRALDAIGMSALVVIATLAPALFRTFYDHRYQESARWVQLLCIPGWFDILKASATSAVLTCGDSRALSAANLVLLVTRIPACVAGFYVAGIPGIIVGGAVGNAVALVPLYRSLNRNECRVFPIDLRASAKMLLLTGLGVFLPILAANQSLVPILAVELVAALGLGLVALSPARVLLTTWRGKTR
jgi:O-antigen/teichoic acid export membrane protein